MKEGLREGGSEGGKTEGLRDEGGEQGKEKKRE